VIEVAVAPPALTKARVPLPVMTAKLDAPLDVTVVVPPTAMFTHVNAPDPSETLFVPVHVHAPFTTKFKPAELMAPPALRRRAEGRSAPVTATVVLTAPLILTETPTPVAGVQAMDPVPPSTNVVLVKPLVASAIAAEAVIVTLVPPVIAPVLMSAEVVNVRAPVATVDEQVTEATAVIVHGAVLQVQEPLDQIPVGLMDEALRSTLVATVVAAAAVTPDNLTVPPPLRAPKDTAPEDVIVTVNVGLTAKPTHVTSPEPVLMEPVPVPEHELVVTTLGPELDKAPFAAMVNVVGDLLVIISLAKET